MEEQKKKKIKIVDTQLGMKFVVGIEQTQKIDPINDIQPSVIIKDLEPKNNIEEEKTNILEVPKKIQRTYSYGYINYLLYGLISVFSAFGILYLFLKK